MRIQRSTFDFLMISAILGSVVVVTSYFGYGAGTLLILFWVVLVLFRLNRSSQFKPDGRNDGDSGDGGGD